MPIKPGERSLLAHIDAQPRVRSYLMRSIESGSTAQSFLFLGAPGVGKLDAAWAMAQAIVCERGGCGACDDCIRAAHHTHPDIHYYAPESATGYLIAQTRALIDDVALAPIRSKSKVYILDHAEKLRANTANALLKTLEEPPENVTFILLGITSDTILPTIVSRCQCVPFRPVAPEVAIDAVERACGVPRERCRMAVSVAGTPARAIDFLKSADRQDCRRQVVRALGMLPKDDATDVLDAAQSLAELVLIPKKQRDKQIDEVKKQNADYLSRGGIKQLEDRTKRELNARERSGIMEILACTRSVMRDVLTLSGGVTTEVVNEDVRDVVERLASHADVAAAVASLDAVSKAEERVANNVTPQLAIEVMLFDIRKALTCR